jgi:hypothetical protein
MEVMYKSETFSAMAGSFDQEFSNFLNSKAKDNWKVKSCSYCHDNEKTVASCIFKKK